MFDDDLGFKHDIYATKLTHDAFKAIRWRFSYQILDRYYYFVVPVIVETGSSRELDQIIDSALNGPIYPVELDISKFMSLLRPNPLLES